MHVGTNIVLRVCAHAVGDHRSDLIQLHISQTILGAEAVEDA